MNGFNGFSLKEKLSNIWYGYRKYIIIISIVVLVMLITLIIVLNSSKNNKQKHAYELVESIMVYNAKEYIKNNEITKDMYISLNYLNIEIDSNLKCNSNSGVLVEDNSYTPYLMCEGYNSQVVANVIKENEENSKYGVLLGDNPYIVTDTYQELGISLVEGYTVNIKDSNIDNGINKVTYNILESGSYVTHIDRIVIAEGILGAAPVIELVGNQTRTLEINTQYIESGYTATDKIDGNITDKVKVDGNVDVTKAGTYTLTYSVTNTRGKSASVKRKVIVNDNSINLEIAHKLSEIVNSSIKITLDIKGEGYSYTITDNGEKVTSKNPTYTAYKNGTYEFTVYDTNNNSEVYEVSISTLDTTPPILTCSGEIKDGKTHIVIDANEKISYYLFENVKSSKNDKIYEEEKEKVVVYGYDMSNNAGSVTCQVGENFYYDDISPTISHNILYTDESDSLKVQVLDTKYGVMSYIWVAKPYEQFKKATSNWGVNTLSPYNIMQNEISTNNLQSKIIIAINASGFYKQGAWVPSCSNTSYLPKYYNTTEGPLVITNGQVIRNWYYDDAIDRSRNHSIYGINPKGKLMAYPKINSYTEEARMKLFQEIIDSGIKNTFCFRPTIITNGEISSDYATSNFMKDGSKRQIMCQINTNNFVFITNYKSTTNSDRISLLKSVGCQTVINMDGGGSLATLFKQKNGDLKVIYGGSRAIVDVAYFTEL